MSGTWPSVRLAAFGARILGSRSLMRAPIWIFKARGGAVFGTRILMLEHIGRKSGMRRYAVLEVIDRPAASLYLVASGFGEQAEWFRNIRAYPRVRVFTGSRAPVQATARVMTQLEADHAIGTYISRHPRAWERFRPVLEHTLGRPISASDTPLPLVELRLG